MDRLVDDQMDGHTNGVLFVCADKGTNELMVSGRMYGRTSGLLCMLKQSVRLTKF